MALEVLQPMLPADGDLASKPTNNHDIGENNMQSNFNNRDSCEVLTNRIYVGNLGYEIDDRDLYYFFYQFGPVHHARIITDRHGYSKGYGFVTFIGSEIVKKLLEWPEKENIWLKGRKLRIGAARTSYWSKESSRNRHPLSQKEYEDGSDNIKSKDFSECESQEVPVTSSALGDSTSYYQITNLDPTAYSGTCSNTPSYPVFFYPTYTQFGYAASNIANYPFSCQDMSSQPYPGIEASIYEDPFYSSYSMYQYECPDMIFTEEEQLAYPPYYQDNNMCMVTYNNPQPFHPALLDNQCEFFPLNEIYQGNQSSELETSDTYIHYYQADQEVSADHSGPQLGDSGFQESSSNEKSIDQVVGCDNAALQETILFKQTDHNSLPETDKNSVGESYFGGNCSYKFPFSPQHRSSYEEVSDIVREKKNVEGKCENETNQCYSVQMSHSLNEHADDSKSVLKNKHVDGLGVETDLDIKPFQCSLENLEIK